MRGRDDDPPASNCFRMCVDLPICQWLARLTRRSPRRQAHPGRPVPGGPQRVRGACPGARRGRDDTRREEARTITSPGCLRNVTHIQVGQRLAGLGAFAAHAQALEEVDGLGEGGAGGERAEARPYPTKPPSERAMLLPGCIFPIGMCLSRADDLPGRVEQGGDLFEGANQGQR